MKTEINLDEIINQFSNAANAEQNPLYSRYMIEQILREAINQALELAAEKAEIKITEIGFLFPVEVKQSILNIKNIIK